MKAPANGQNFNDDIIFKWEIEGNTVPAALALKILDNQQHVIFSAQVAGSLFELRQLPPPGAYYWTLEYESEMLHLGKFFVEME